MFRNRHPFLMTFVEDMTPGGSNSSDDEAIESTDAEDPADADGSDIDGEEEPEEEWDRERSQRKIRKINSENKRLRERAKQAEEKAETANDLDQKYKALELEHLRLDVAYDLGLPKNLAARLQGSTREELISDAEALIELIGPAAPRRQSPPNRFGEGHSDKAPVETPKSLDDLAAEFMRD